MILIPSEHAEKFHETGIWGNVTLDGLFRKNAEAHPDRVAMVDAPDRETWTGGAPRNLTYREMDREIERVAGMFTTLGLTPDNVVGFQVVSTVDSVVTMLAALRAGLVVSPLPLTWGNREITAAMSRISAKAIVASDRCEDISIGENIRDAAVDLFGLRFVLGLGEDLPDGLIDVHSFLAEAGDELPEVELNRQGIAADHIATLSWSTGPDGLPFPVPRNHNHWIAAGLMTMLEANLKEGCQIVSPYSPSNLVGFGAALVPWLLRAGTLHLCHPVSMSALIHRIVESEADLAVVPGPLLASLTSRLPATTDGVTLGAAWASGVQLHGQPEASRQRPIVDLTILDELAIVAIKRSEGSSTPAPLEMGDCSAPSEAEGAPVLLTLSGKAEQNSAPLCLSGPMVPTEPWDSEHEYWPSNDSGLLETRLQVLTNGQSVSQLSLRTSPGDRFFYAGTTGYLEAIDEIYAGFPGAKDAAAFLMDDPIIGCRLCAAVVPADGAGLDEAAFQSHLENMRAGLQLMPSEVVSVTAIPRNEIGSVIRETLSPEANMSATATA
ncbi:MAG: class I adenylate-forming enzyme family protein [Stappiaceae bacterium]